MLRSGHDNDKCAEGTGIERLAFEPLAGVMVATSYEELQTIRPLDMALDVFKRKYGGTEMPDTMKQLLESVIKEAGV